MWFFGIVSLTVFAAWLDSLNLKTAKCVRVKKQINIKATLSLMAFITFIFALLCDESCIETLPLFKQTFGTNNIDGLSAVWLLKLVSNNFVHADIGHLTDNLILLSICGLYESRVGTKRFIKVFAISCLIASFSVLLIPWPIETSVGASGGIFGLLAAYIIDGKVSFKFKSIKGSRFSRIKFIGIEYWIILIGYFSISHFLIDGLSAGEVNYTGHLLGAIGATLFCVFVRQKEVINKSYAARPIF